MGLPIFISPEQRERGHLAEIQSLQQEAQIYNRLLALLERRAQGLRRQRDRLERSLVSSSDSEAASRADRGVVDRRLTQAGDTNDMRERNMARNLAAHQEVGRTDLRGQASEPATRAERAREDNLAHLGIPAETNQEQSRGAAVSPSVDEDLMSRQMAAHTLWMERTERVLSRQVAYWNAPFDADPEDTLIHQSDMEYLDQHFPLHMADEGTRGLEQALGSERDPTDPVASTPQQNSNHYTEFLPRREQLRAVESVSAPSSPLNQRLLNRGSQHEIHVEQRAGRITPPSFSRRRANPLRSLLRGIWRRRSGEN